MVWNLVEGRPIYAQLLEQIRMRIAAGRYAPGEKLPSVRDLAAEAAVNPNTMQKALAELERTGLIVTQRTSGKMVTEDETLIRSVRRELAREQVAVFFEQMRSLGYTTEEIKSFVNEIYEGGNGTNE